MQDTKTGGSRWIPDIRPEEIDTYEETNNEESATYKLVDAHPILSHVLDKLAFFRTHAAAVWYNKLANKTVKDKLDEIDTSIGALSSKGSVVTSQAIVTPVYEQDFIVTSINLKAGHKYLVLGHVTASISQDSYLVCSIETDSDTSEKFGGGSNYSTMGSGGGTTAYAIITCNSDTTVRLMSYGYYDGDYSINGDICAIQLD